MSTPDSYSGDVMITGDEPSPIEIVDPENVHVLRGAVDGDLKIVDAGYVFTNTPTGGTATVDGAETEITGSLEDSYIVPGGATGDVVVRDAEDVFIEHDAVAGDLQVVGSEKEFHDSSAATPPPRGQYDDAVTGWKRSTTVRHPSVGVAVAGGRCSAHLEGVEGDVDIYVTGWENTVDIEGTGSVSLHLAGSHNTIEVGQRTDLTVVSDTGDANDIDSAPLPHSELIETSKREAFPLFGRAKVTYQTPAPDEEYCKGCGASSQTIIQRHRTDALFLFRTPVYRFDEGGTTYRCENCAHTTDTSVGLSESERRDLFR